MVTNALSATCQAAWLRRGSAWHRRADEIDSALWRETMQRTQVLIGAIGMMLSAAAVHADLIDNSVKTGDTVTLFGQKFTAEVHKRDGTYANGVKITLQGPDTDTTQKANLSFVPG